MRLENLIKEVKQKIYNKIKETKDIPDEDAEKISGIVGLAALKYADLSNQIAKDYIFDIDKFTSFEGNTGPYILYTAVRIKSILKKYYETNGEIKNKEIQIPTESIEKKMLITIAKYNEILENTYNDNAPHILCAYLYELANLFNAFYQRVKILQGDKEKMESNIILLTLIKEIFENGVELLGFEIPDKM